MAVYVDNGRARFGRMIMSHMLADTDEELHKMAADIGVALRWFQYVDTTPHYDVCQSKRDLAISLGAKIISRRELVELIRRKRNGNTA